MHKRQTSTMLPERPAGTTMGLFAALVLALAVPPGYGQTTAEPPSEAPSIVKNVEEVTIDLVVRRKNKPVLDLKPGEIAVTDTGSSVKLSDLRLVTGTTGSDHLVTLVFDQLDPSAASNARRITKKILDIIPASGFSFSVLTVGGRLRLLQEFTTDRKAVDQAIAIATDKNKTDAGNDAALPEKRLIAVAQTGTDLSGVRVGAKERAAAQLMLAALQESQRIGQDRHTQPSLSGLLALARTQRQAAGRKVVIYFAQGLQADSSDQDMLGSIVAAANRANVSLYTVDANALSPQASQQLVSMMVIGGMIAGNAQQGPSPLFSGTTSLPQAIPGIQPQANDQLGRFESGDQAGSRDPLADLAISTEGAYIAPGENLKKPLQRMIEDMTTYYEASFVPAIHEYNGQFRPVVVKPLRKGIKIRSRSGYFALPLDTGFGTRPFEVPLMKILEGPQLPTDLKFRSALLRLGELPNGNENVLVVEVPLAELNLLEDANANLFSAHLSIVAQIKDKTGTVLEHFGADIPRHGALESKESARSEVVTLQRHFLAGPGQYVLEAAVADRNSGKTGAQRVNFEIPSAPSGASLSDVALVQRTDPFAAEADPLEPLRYQNGRVVPSLSGQVPPGAKNISLFFMVHPDPHAGEPASLEMEVLRNGELFGRTPLPLRKSSGEGAIPYLASIQAKSLAAGIYEATAILTQNGRTSESRVSFRIEGPELASAAGMAADAAYVSRPRTSNSGQVSDAKLQTSGIEPHRTGGLVITALPASAVTPPTPEELQVLVEDARKRAVSYAGSLPNFMCVEVTDRSFDPQGNGRWRHRDSMAELLRYRDNAETRTTLEINGKRASTQRADLKGTLSRGEFGGMLKTVFQPSSKAEFQWKETDALGSGTVQVLSYRVARENSSYSLIGANNSQIAPAFHGLVYIDPATKGVRRITVEADDLPSDFSIHAASMTVDYDYVTIGAHDHLMPLRATVRLRQGKRESVLNEMMFRNYKRYGSQTKISYGGQVVH